MMMMMMMMNDMHILFTQILKIIVKLQWRCKKYLKKKEEEYINE